MIKNTIIFFLLLSTILCTIECIPFLTFFLFSVLLFLLFLSRSRGGIWKYYLFFLLIFLRLFFFQYNFSEDIKKLDCWQNRQDIDSHYSNQITLSWTLYKNTSNKNFTIHTLFWKFTLTSYTPIHYEDWSIIAIQWTITCFHSPIIPFSYESLLIARWYRGVIQLENTTLLSSNKHPLSISFPHVALDSKSDWIPEWIIFWDTSFLSSSLYNLFLDSGLVYLISASWWNIALLITLVTYIFFFLPYTYRRGVLFICILLYSYVLGENLASLRAFLTYTISQLVFPKKYYISSLRIIRITFLSLLLYLSKESPEGCALTQVKMEEFFET